MLNRGNNVSIAFGLRDRLLGTQNRANWGQKRVQSVQLHGLKINDDTVVRV